MKTLSKKKKAYLAVAQRVNETLMPEERMAVQAALSYWDTLPYKMKETVFNHYKNNNDDWANKSKEELQAIVGKLS